MAAEVAEIGSTTPYNPQWSARPTGERSQASSSGASLPMARGARPCVPRASFGRPAGTFYPPEEEPP
jgi:hypothetical protein